MSISIGHKIRDLRKKVNLSQQKFGDAVGIPKITIQRIERTGKIGATNLNKIIEHPDYAQYSEWLLGQGENVQESPKHYLADKFDRLPRAKQRELLDYMDFLLAQQDKEKT